MAHMRLPVSLIERPEPPKSSQGAPGGPPLARKKGVSQCFLEICRIWYDPEKLA